MKVQFESNALVSKFSEVAAGEMFVCNSEKYVRLGIDCVVPNSNVPSKTVNCVRLSDGKLMFNGKNVNVTIYPVAVVQAGAPMVRGKVVIVD